jgi:hypothetical protein
MIIRATDHQVSTDMAFKNIFNLERVRGVNNRQAPHARFKALGLAGLCQRIPEAGNTGLLSSASATRRGARRRTTPVHSYSEANCNFNGITMHWQVYMRSEMNCFSSRYSFLMLPKQIV